MPSEFEKLCRRRTVTNNKLSTLIVKANTPGLTKQQIKLYIDQVEPYWHEANLTYSEMCALAKDDELAQIDFESVDKTFDEERVKLGTLLETVAATSASKEVKLPKLELPTFSGNPEEWLAFRDLFTVAVHDNPVLKGSLNLQYLLLALKGKAANCVQSPTATMLPPGIGSTNGFTTSTESPTALRALVNNTNECVTNLIVLERAVDKWDDMLVYILVEKLDDESRRELELSLVTEDPPTFTALMEFLEQRARALVTLEKAKDSTTPVTSTVSSLVAQEQEKQVLLSTALVKVRDASGGQQVIRAMLDNGSQVSIITSSCVQRLGLSCKRATINVTGISNCNAGTSRGRVELQLSSCVAPTFHIGVDAIILPKQSGHLPLLGADVYGELLLDGRKSGPPGTPIAMNTSLGWVVLGPTGTCGSTVTSLVVQSSLESHLQKFWEQSLFSTLLRFRSYPVPFIAHVEKMFRMIGVAGQHWDYQRVFWRDDKDHPIREYWLVVLVFGTTCAPYLAVRCLHLLQSIPPELRGSQNLLNLCDDQAVGTLGLRWHLDFDSFKFEVTLPPSHPRITKRTLASDIASLYDPLGWLAPITVLPKDLIRQTWQLKLGWDLPVPANISEQWVSF
ncbi:unnamed protein product, partial [Allacma fusca]